MEQTQPAAGQLVEERSEPARQAAVRRVGGQELAAGSQSESQVRAAGPPPAQVPVLGQGPARVPTEERMPVLGLWRGRVQVLAQP